MDLSDKIRKDLIDFCHQQVEDGEFPLVEPIEYSNEEELEELEVCQLCSEAYEDVDVTITNGGPVCANCLLYCANYLFGGK
jgi:formylmethanofuran dehydrogenase subunit E